MSFCIDKPERTSGKRQREIQDRRDQLRKAVREAFNDYGLSAAKELIDKIISKIERI